MLVKDVVYKKKEEIISFCFAFALMIWLFTSNKTMGIGYSGDVTDIWKTITSFYSGNIQPSYVLYKGILSVYPYVWFYELSKIFGVGSWSFIKIFHCFLFSYVSAIGFPYIVSKLLRIEIKFWRRILLILLMFILWKPNGALQYMMIDLWSLFLFVLAASAVIKLSEKDLEHHKIFTFLVGLILGFASLGSGQYFLPAIILTLYVLVNKFLPSNIKNFSKKSAAFLSFIILFSGIMIPRAYDNHFEKTIVNPMRENGAFIAKGVEWAELGIGQAKRRYSLFWEPTIPNNRSLAIIKQDKGDDYENFAKNGVYNKKEVLHLILKHPVDFITSWCNGFLLTVSMHGEHRSVLCLFISYTALFLALYAVFKRCKNLKDILSKKLLIILSFISVIIAPCLNHFEARYVIAFQGLFLCLAFLDNIFWEGLKRFKLFLKRLFSKSEHLDFKNLKFPYPFVIYLLFVIMCFTNYAALIENVGVDPSILFNWIY